MWFVETADMLAKMARETLVNARYLSGVLIFQNNLGLG